MDPEVVTTIVASLGALAGAVFSAFSLSLTARTNRHLGARIEAGEVFAYLSSAPDSEHGGQAVCVIENRTDQVIKNVKIQISGTEIVSLAELPPGQARLQFDDVPWAAEASLSELNTQTSLSFLDHTGFRWVNSADGLRQLSPGERESSRPSLARLTIVTAIGVLATGGAALIAIWR